MKIKSVSARQTQAIAKKLAKHLLKESRFKYALLLALSGNLGSGKTTFVQGFLRSFGVKQKITSPTFVLIKRFKIEDSRFKSVYHIDAYRIKKPKDLTALGLKEILADPQNIVLIEWAEKVRKLLPKNTTWLKFEHGEKGNQRVVKIK